MRGTYRTLHRKVSLGHIPMNFAGAIPIGLCIYGDLLYSKCIGETWRLYHALSVTVKHEFSLSFIKSVCSAEEYATSLHVCMEFHAAVYEIMAANTCCFNWVR